MGRGKAADTEKRHHDGDLRLLNEIAKPPCRTRKRHAAAREYERALRSAQDLRSVLELFRAYRVSRGTRRKLDRRVIPYIVAFTLLRVLRDVDEHGTGTAAFGDMERLFDGRGNVLGLGNQKIVLRDRKGDACDVCFLKRICTDDTARNLPCNKDDGRRIEHRRGYPRDEIRGTWARGRDRDAGTPGSTPKAVGHVRRALLVPHENVMDTRIEQGIIDRQNRATRIAEDRLDPLVLEGVPEDLGSCLARCYHLPTGW